MTGTVVEDGVLSARVAMRAACRRDERESVAALTGEFAAAAIDATAVAARARRLIEGLRQQRRGAGGVDHLMREFSLSTQEGIALMCLAEALLRIPDAATADRLIRDKIGGGDWAAHLHASAPLFVNAATWGLLITGQLVATHSEAGFAGALTRAIARGGEPLIRGAVDQAMRLLGRQFVIGESIDAALLRSRAQEARGYTHSFDMLGEAALTTADALRYHAAYEGAIVAIGAVTGGRSVSAAPGISVKLSALHPRYLRAQRQRVCDELLPRLAGLAKLAADHNIGLNIDAEESERLELSLDLFAALAGDPALAGWDGLGFVVQAYQKRSPFVVDWLIALARRSRRRLMVRLVKGAYWDSEIKRAQVDGLADYPVFTRKAHTDLCYLVCARRLLLAKDAVYPQLATHNAQTLASVECIAADLGRDGVDDYEFQCLHGMGEPLYDTIVGSRRRCRVYAPVGTHETLLPYLVRRLLENGANSSFVNRLVDETVSVDELVAAPLAMAQASGGRRHPAIPLPAALFGASRRNSAGVDLADETVLGELDKALDGLRRQTWSARPRLADAATPADAPAGARRRVVNPADPADGVGEVVAATLEQVTRAVAHASAYAAAWRATPVGERAAMLERAADLLEAQRAEIFSLCIREAGKTRANAVAELREAVDFCRYYAAEIRRIGDDPALPAPGPVACISPWNFPLAIFVGQVAAALAAGSPVLAKPAQQTPLLADFAVGLLHRAGVPAAALQLLPGAGETVGAALVADPRVRGVVFTGSAAVARLIDRTLAQRADNDGTLRLIAETGGQNAMIVDSSALPEQVVQDVLASAFDSAGQRCSALRVLCLQREIADKVLALLKAAMCELSVGDPARLSTDVGPVIDEAAKAALEAYVDAARDAGRVVFRQPLPAACTAGSFVSPTLIEIDAIGDLRHEVFGPILHVLRYRADELPALLAAVNATGYGLTMGVHSRIDETINAVAAAAHAGNLYVNRNMIGAVVGVQPFGGEGLSGTGPKAGGPLYLHRLRGSSNVPPALPAMPAMRRVDGEQRLTIFQALSDWAREQGESGLMRICADYAALTLLPFEIDLPGPTGERNTLHFAPRGRVLCVADSPAALLGQLAAVFATGNRPLVGELDAALAARLPPLLLAAIELTSPPEEAVPAAVLYAGPPGAASALRQRLAAGDGARVPVIGSDPGNGRYPLYRLLLERVRSVNTAAAGGNTTLITLIA